MIKFLFKGILRDKSRSVLPIIIIAIGSALTVMLSGYMAGVFNDLTEQSARFDTGHVKVMTKPYLENIDQLPNDLSLLDVGDLIGNLEKEFPDMKWVERIRFGGLIDVPGANNDSKGQGPAVGIALNLLDTEKEEAARMNIPNSIVTGTIPTKKGEAIIGHALAEKLDLKIGDDITYFGSTMNGSMTFHGFEISGTVRFGTAAMDKGVIIVDISDAQQMLDMEDGAGEVLGFANNNVFDADRTLAIATTFNEKYSKNEDEFAPIMKTLKQQNNLGELIDYSNAMSGAMIFIFVIAMSVVLWNTGLIAGLRRYKEYGIRLALGESKGEIYSRMIMEAALVGIIGSVIGTGIGLVITIYLQNHGIDMGDALKDSSMMMPNVLRSKVTPSLFYIGFIPGLLAMVLGNMLSGLGIYKRETASLFKELEI